MTAPTWIPELIGWLFLVTNAGRLLAYFPQIVAAARCDAGARSVSLLTWSYFAFAHFTALLYAIYVLGDSRSIGIFCGNFVVTLVLVAIVVVKRRRHRRAGRIEAARKARAGGKVRPLPPRRTERPGRQERLVTRTPIDGNAAPGIRRTALRFGLQAVTLRAAR